MKSTMLFTFILLLTTTITSISMLTCYDCPPRHYNFFITPDNIPTFTDCSIILTDERFCALNFYSNDNGNTSNLSASPTKGIEKANVPYISTGFSVPKGFDSNISLGIWYQCMIDDCNNPQTILKRILEATKIETYKPSELSLKTDQSLSAETFLCSTFLNFTSIDDCRPDFNSRRLLNTAENCSTYCVTAINIDPIDLQTERVCSYCENQPTERYTYIDERIHLLDKRISYLEQLEYLCNSTDNCNSMENIRQIQQRYKIEFDFEIFFGPNDTTTTMTTTVSDMTTTKNGTTVVTLSGILQYIMHVLLILFIYFK